jgi:hypothetical protein
MKFTFIRYKDIDKINGTMDFFSSCLIICHKVLMLMYEGSTPSVPKRKMPKVLCRLIFLSLSRFIENISDIYIFKYKKYI